MHGSMLLYSTPTRVNVYYSIHDRLLFAIAPPSSRRAKSIDYTTGHTWAILLAKLRTTTDVLQLDVFSSLVKVITFYVPSENSTQLLKNNLLYKLCYSLYGSATWDLLHPEAYRICSTWRIALRRICSVCILITLMHVICVYRMYQHLQCYTLNLLVSNRC